MTFIHVTLYENHNSIFIQHHRHHHENSPLTPTKFNNTWESAHSKILGFVRDRKSFGLPNIYELRKHNGQCWKINLFIPVTRLSHMDEIQFGFWKLLQQRAYLNRQHFEHHRAFVMKLDAYIDCASYFTPIYLYIYLEFGRAAEVGLLRYVFLFDK